MIDCLILGDSIAVGTHMARPDCQAVAKGGINSWQFNKQHPEGFETETAIISLGANDHRGVHTKKELESLRSRIKAKKVYWILPVGNDPRGGVNIEDTRYLIEEIANQNNDLIIKIPEVSTDGIHPTSRGYKKIGELAK
jgi:hypothetical protein